MGAASFLKMNIDEKQLNLAYLTRSASASTATGYAKQHGVEQQALVEAAFKL
jgi:2-oxoglutarate dehydrogenase E1 component